jgi:hypothetical protein
MPEETSIDISKQPADDVEAKRQDHQATTEARQEDSGQDVPAKSDDNTDSPQKPAPAEEAEQVDATNQSDENGNVTAVQEDKPGSGSAEPLKAADEEGDHVVEGEEDTVIY